MMRKKILFVGAIGGMSYATKLAESLGYDVYCVDYYEDSQAKEYAYKSYNISTTDFISLSELIEKENITAIFSGFSDVNIRTTSILCAKYNLPCYINEKQFLIMQNKLEFRNLCEKYEISAPKKYDDINNNITYPVIVKPSDAYAAKGISVCSNYKELNKSIKKAEKISRNGKAIIEDYIEGNEVMIHYVMVNGHLKISSILNRKLASSFKKESKSLAPVLIYNDTRFKQNVLEQEPKLEKMMLDLGFTNVVGFLQGIEKNGIVYFFEPAIRFGGNLSEIFNVYCNGINIVEKFIDYSYYGKINDKGINDINPSFDNYCCNITLFLKCGIIKKVRELIDISTINNVVDVQRYYHLNDVIEDKDLYTYKDIAYRIILIGNDKDEVISSVNKLKDSILIYDQYDNSMIDWSILLKAFED